MGSLIADSSPACHGQPAASEKRALVKRRMLPGACLSASQGVTDL